MIAIRDSEVAAQSMGISLAKFKTLAFSISAFIAGVAGCLYAYKMTFINPASFGIGLSIEFLALVIIGGLGSIHGVVYGAAFVILLPADNYLAFQIIYRSWPAFRMHCSPDCTA
ncbi:MAG: branched-chain amino acid ABC transporter permease [Desulfobacterales bacterium]|nr:branched-chain amino acid ABC transporter permease [Desulfobacterales bacterium]